MYLDLNGFEGLCPRLNAAFYSLVRSYLCHF